MKTANTSRVLACGCGVEEEEEEEEEEREMLREPVRKFKREEGVSEREACS